MLKHNVDAMSATAIAAHQPYFIIFLDKLLVSISQPFSALGDWGVGARALANRM